MYWTGEKRWYRAVVDLVLEDEGAIEVHYPDDGAVCKHGWSKNRWGTLVE